MAKQNQSSESSFHKLNTMSPTFPEKSMIAVFLVKMTFNLIVEVKYMKPKYLTFIQLCLQLIYCVVVFCGGGLAF